MATMGRRASRRRNIQIIVTALLILTTCAVVGAVTYFTMSRPGALDSRMCPSEGPTGHTVVLVDTTDPLTFTQKQAFAVLFRQTVERDVPEGHLLSVFVLGENFKENGSPVAELCNPGTGANKSDLTANVKKLRRQYEEQFLQPLLKQAEALVATQPARYSPVFEMLQLAAINGFRKQGVQGVRRLILVSDMLHNTPQFSMYKQLPEYKSFSDTPYGQKTQLELADVKVELHYLLNSPTLQTRKNLQFWEEHFNKAGARLVAVRPLEG